MESFKDCMQTLQMLPMSKGSMMNEGLVGLVFEIKKSLVREVTR